MLRRFIIGAVGITSLIFGSLAILPDTSIFAQSGGGQGVEISPALVELNAQRGGTYDIAVKVKNVTTTDLDYIVSVEDFNAKDESGSPQVLIGSDLPDSISIKSWVSSVDMFSLKSQESRTVNFKLTVPDSAEPGGHYGVLRFSGTDPQVSVSGVGLSASAGSLILMRVDGDIKEEATLESFITESNGSRSWLFEKSPVTLVTRINNSGNIHIKPVGNIEIKNFWGNIVQSIPLNETRSNVLPGSIRRFESTTSSDWMFGKYTASLALGYGNQGQAITSIISFWVIPYKIIAVGIIVLATIVYIMRNLIKAYNRRIIAKSKNETNTKTKKNK